MTLQRDSSVAFSPEMARNLSDDGWCAVELLDVVDSTNAHALRAPVAWQLVASHEQRAGRGRLDRSWQVPAGTAVTMSMTLPLPAESSDWGWVPLFVGDAVRAAIVSLAGETHGAEPGGGPGDGAPHASSGLATGPAVATKWPNDVLLRDPDGQWRKVCGVLCQVVPGDAPLVVAGVGVNITQTRDELPVPAATSLALAGIEASRDETLLAVAREVRRAALVWATGSRDEQPALRDRVRTHCRTIGHEVDVHAPDGQVHRGRATAIDDAGRLVTTSPGSRPGETSTMVFSVADVVHARLAG